jgi:hypothetical protein
MKKLIGLPAAAARFDEQGATGVSGFSYRRHVAAPRARFAASSVDLLGLVVAEALKRQAQAGGIRRDVLRDAACEMPPPLERNHERNPPIQRPDSDA